MNKKKKILIIGEDRPGSSPRLRMELNALGKDFDICVTGIKAPDFTHSTAFENIEFIDLSKMYIKEKKIDFHFNYPYVFRKTISFFIKYFFQGGFSKDRYFRKKYWTVSLKTEYGLLREKDFSLVIVHHLLRLPLAVKIAEQKKVPVIFNAHEFYLGEYDNRQEWNKDIFPFYKEILDRFIEKTSLVLTVAPVIDCKYRKKYKVETVIFPNLKPFSELLPSSINGSSLRMVHHGAAIRDRYIEKSIELMRLLPSTITLHLMLTPNDEKYLEELKQMAADIPNIIFHDPVPFEEIIPFINQFDVGLFLLPPVNFNYTYALPNKFFEFVQAKLAIAIGPSPEMAYYVKKYELGIVSEDFEIDSLADCLRSLTKAAVETFKKNSLSAARELSSENTEKILLEKVHQLLN